MQDAFDQKKESILREIGATNGGIPDLSPKGSIDEICIPIINTINANADMVTTSSCSGRVSVFLEGVKNVASDDTKIGAKGNQGRWIFVTHTTDNLKGWFKDIDFTYQQSIPSLDVNARYILYKFEPLILHVKCRDAKSATALYTAAMNCGFRESGIGSNNIVAVRISIKLDIPIGYLEGEDKLVSFVTEEYLGLITQLSFDRFRENFKKLDILHKAVSELGKPVAAPVTQETKEERRARKIQEGMARRDGVRLQKEQLRQEKQRMIEQAQSQQQS